MSLPVFFPSPEISNKLPSGRSLTFMLHQLCLLAGVDCRVSGRPAERIIKIATNPQMKAVIGPNPLGDVWLGIPSPKRQTIKRRALLALGFLAYGVFDYGARETLRGLKVSRPGRSVGRPRSASSLSGAERQRRHRRTKKAEERRPGTSEV
jgi:hypothetical protein